MQMQELIYFPRNEDVPLPCVLKCKPPYHSQCLYHSLRFRELECVPQRNYIISLLALHLNHTFLFFLPLFLCFTFFIFPCSCCFFANKSPSFVLRQCLFTFVFQILSPFFCCAHTGAFVRPGPIFFLLEMRKSLSSCSLFVAIFIFSLC